MLSYTKSRLSAAKAGFAGKNLLLFIIVLSSFCTLNSFAQSYGWMDISANIPGTPDLSDVFFVSDDEGWISVSSGAIILHTTDGGATFEIQTNPFSTSLGAIYMIDENEGYAGGGSGFVYKTIDGGVNWNFHGSIASPLRDMDFASATQGYASGDAGKVCSITPQGVTNLNSGQPTNFSGISSPSVNNVWLCGGNDIMYYNGTIFEFQAGPAGTYTAICFINNDKGWVVGNAGLIGHTENGGENWHRQINPVSYSLSDVFFLNTEVGWAVGSTGTILQTSDGGENWKVEGAGLTTNALRGIHFTSPTNGYVVGNGKTLLKYGELTSVENEVELPTEFSLSQNYPNPFNPSTKIKYKIPLGFAASPFSKGGIEGGFVTLKVYDVLGNEVATLVNEEKPAGSYEVEFQSTVGSRQLASGIYFYQLKAGNYIQTKKMILMK